MKMTEMQEDMPSEKHNNFFAHGDACTHSNVHVIGNAGRPKENDRSVSNIEEELEQTDTNAVENIVENLLIEAIRLSKTDRLISNTGTCTTTNNVHDNAHDFTKPSCGVSGTEHESIILSKINGNEHDRQLNYETESPADEDATIRANSPAEMEQAELRNERDHTEKSMDFSESASKDEVVTEDADDEQSRDDNEESRKPSKAKKKKADRKSKEKDEKNSIHSETQRIIRESRVSLPYHHPRQMSLKDFLNRKKNTRNLEGNTSTPKEKNCVTDVHQTKSEEVSKSEKGNNIPLDETDKPKTGSASEKFTTPLQELKHNLMAVRKSISLPKISTEPFYDPVCAELCNPVGVDQLISRFIKHTSKPSTPATPETRSLNIISKDIDSSGKEILKKEQINVIVTPTALNISSGPKINELKLKLRSEISMKKMRQREKRLLAYKLDNEEVNDEEELFSDDDASLEDGLKKFDSDDSASEDNEMDVAGDDEEEEEEDSEKGEESEEDDNDESDDEDDVIHTSKARNKRCLFLDDEAEESGEDGGCDDNLEETDDEVNDKVAINENLNDEEMKNEEQDMNTSAKFDQQAETDVPILKRDADSSFEMIGSLIPAAQPGGGMKFGGNPSTADSDSEEERTSLLNASSQELSQKDHNESQDNLEPKLVFNPSWNKDNDDPDANDLLLQFCSGRFTQKTPLLEANKENMQSTTKADDSSDDDSLFIIGRKRISNKPELVLRKNIDSEESASEVDFSDAEIEEQEFAGFSSKKKGKILKEFLDQEAELSGSDICSEDEQEGDGDDEFEADGLTEEVLNEDKLRDEIGRVHFKTMLDEDKKELRFFQEMYLEDGDLHTEGQGRERKFRWKNINDSQDGNNDKASDEEENEEEEDENWRVKRYERELWLQEQKVLEDTPSPKKKLFLNVKLVNRTVTASDKPIENLIKVKESNEKSSSRSFLFRDRKSLSHLAEKYNKVEDDRVGKRATKNFVFTTTSPVKTIKPAMKRSRTDSTGGNNSKKPKVTLLRSNSVFNYF